MEERLKELQQIPVGQVFYANGKLFGWEVRKCRCKRAEDGTVFVYAPKKRLYGHRYPETAFCRDFSGYAVKGKGEEAEWHHRINRAIKALESSGLWENILEVLRGLSKMTLEDKRALRSICINTHLYLRDDPAKNPAAKWRPLIEAYKAEVAPFVSKYPFAFTDKHYTLDDGSEAAFPLINSDYVFDMSDVTLKSMYFGKYQNAGTKVLIANAITYKHAFSHTCRTSYDVSFEYDPVKNRAWYIEAYKDCGNGHYYLALDNNLALFYDND